MYLGSQRRFQTWTSVLTVSSCMALSWMRIIRYVGSNQHTDWLEKTLKFELFLYSSMFLSIRVSKTMSTVKGESTLLILPWPSNSEFYLYILMVILEICEVFTWYLENYSLLFQWGSHSSYWVHRGGSEDLGSRVQGAQQVVSHPRLSGILEEPAAAVQILWISGGQHPSAGRRLTLPQG